MTLALASRRTALTPPFVRNGLWRRARAVPSLDLRFADNKSLTDSVTGASLVTFTRASSGTYTDSAGVLQTAATDVPRFDHNPITGESLGLLVEEQRTNLMQRSEEFENAYWFKSAATITSNATTAPNGATTADKLVETAVSAEHIAAVLSMGLASNVYTVSVFAKAAERTQISIFLDTGITRRTQYFNLSTGTLGTNSGGLTSSIQAFADGWYRCSVTLNAAETLLNVVYTTALSGSNNYLGNASSGVFLWGAQLEAGAFPTSYILNVNTALGVTRSADVCSITGSAFSGWYRQDEGTMFTQYIQQPARASALVAQLSDNSAANRIGFQDLDGTTPRWFQVRSNSSEGSAAGAARTPGAIVRHALRMKTNDFRAAYDGILTAQDSSITPPTVSQLDIGKRETAVELLNGRISRITFWPVGLVDSTLQQITQ